MKDCCHQNKQNARRIQGGERKGEEHWDALFWSFFVTRGEKQFLVALFVCLFSGLHRFILVWRTIFDDCSVSINVIVAFGFSVLNETCKVYLEEVTYIRGIPLHMKFSKKLLHKLITSMKESVLKHYFMANIFCLNSRLRCSTLCWSWRMGITRRYKS